MMATEVDTSNEPSYERKPAKRTLSTSKKWKFCSAAVHDYVSLHHLVFEFFNDINVLSKLFPIESVKASKFGQILIKILIRPGTFISIFRLMLW